MLAAVLLAVAWVVRDYRGWLALGPGGLPHTARGWLTMTALRVRTWRVDPFDTAESAVTVHLADALPKRVGPRPAVARYPIPHRQLDQFPEPAFVSALTVASFVASRPLLTVRQSYFERHNDAVYATPEILMHADGQISGGEVGHVHADGSLHVVLDLADAAVVIEHGWGQLHPAAGIAAGLPAGYVLVYAPRTADEVAVVEQLLDAAAMHMAGTGTSS